MRGLRAQLVAVTVLVLGWGAWQSARLLSAQAAAGYPVARAHLTPEHYEGWARARFERQHPGEKPLNWAIGQAAVALYRERPMGKFVLGVKPGVWGNDCSDFVEGAIDEGLGVGARWHRPGAREHLIGYSEAYFDFSPLAPGQAVMPGDVVHVRHSPWYAPDPRACSHVGIVGSDGQVYDFAKLRSWSGPRYGRHSLAWFTRHSGRPGEVIIGRLKPQYRYRLVEIPRPAPHAAASPAGGA